MSWIARRLAAASRAPFRRQLGLGAAAVVTVAALVTTTAIVAGEYFISRAVLVADLQVQARMIAANSSAALVFDDADAAAEILGALKASEDVAAARLYRDDGRLLAAFGNPGLARQWLELREPVHYLGRDYGWLVIDADLHRLNQRMLLYAFGAVGVLVLSAILTLWLFARVVDRITAPIDSLIALMQRVAREGDYSRRSGIRSGNEIGQIARSFDLMLGEIELRQQALTHELEERRRTQAQLDHLARHDPLTQLGNRHALQQRMDEVQRQCREQGLSCALLLLDLDNFKVVNDSLGHQAGDQLLTQMAIRLQTMLGESTPAYRLGGDEFAILLTGESLDSACQSLCRAILELMRPRFEIGSHEVFATVSVGFALYPSHAAQLEQLMRPADLALYAAKAQGRDTWRAFTPEMREKADQRLQLESDLRRALERREFHLVYEPQIDLASGRLGGVEALLRWQHPERGLVGPAEFIPVAEETGMIVAIGEWVLRQACRDGPRLLSLGLPPDFRLAVNLAPRQLAEPGLATIVAEALAASGFAARHLELEITESAMTERIELVAERMQAIARLGVSFAMDDFGTGASSLNYLRRLPISKLKIDRSFVSDIPGSHADCEIAAAIIAIGSRLRMPVLAEGIETLAQLEFLRSQGCAYGQGHHFARPLPVEDFLADWRCRLGLDSPRLVS